MKNLDIYEISTVVKLKAPDGKIVKLGHKSLVPKWEFANLCLGLKTDQECVGIRQGKRISYFKKHHMHFNFGSYFTWAPASYKEVLAYRKKEHERQLILTLANVK